MSYLPIRLLSGADLRRALEQEAAAKLAGSVFVVAGIGSLSAASIRFASAEQENHISGPLEIISLSGSLSANGAHLHISVATASGQVIGGHLCYGSNVRTTAEVLLLATEGWSLTRMLDTSTGYQELQVSRLGPGESAA